MFGMPIPDALKNPPELEPGLEWYLDCFWKLHTGRPTGFGEGRIPYIDVLQYAQILGLDAEETEDLEYMIRELDNTYLEWRAEQDKAGSQTTPAAKPAKRPAKGKGAK